MSFSTFQTHVKINK